MTNIERTKQFYIFFLGFKLEYERINEKFMFLSYGESHFMFEEIHLDGWNVASLKCPLGRGANFPIACSDVEKLYEVVKNRKIKIYRELKETIYLCDGNQKRFKKNFLYKT